MNNQAFRVQIDPDAEDFSAGFKVVKPAVYTPDDETLDYMLRVLDLETKVRYLIAVEQAARRYIRRSDSRTAKQKTIKSARVELLDALDNFERLQIDEWVRGTEE